jgi:hypothetical protein
MLVPSCACSPSPTGLAEYRVEIFSPPYVFRTDRPKIMMAPDSALWGATLRVTVDSSYNPVPITGAVLVAPSSVTHSFNAHQVRGQRREGQTCLLEVTAPRVLASTSLPDASGVL